MKISEILNISIKKLEKSGVENPANDARLLLAHVLDKDVSYIIGHFDENLNEEQISRYEDFVDRRAKREPLSHITQKRGFWKHEFFVSCDVLDPRPDSETLIETVLDLYSETPPKNMLEFGVGSGCLILSLMKEFRDASAMGVDISKKALAITKKNATLLDCSLKLVESNWGENINGSFDLIISNPPYIAKSDIEELQPEVKDYEPYLALSGGDTGLDAFYPLFDSIKKLLAENGFAVLEIGQNQEKEIVKISEKYGLKCVRQVSDLAGIIRILVFKFN